MQNPVIVYEVAFPGVKLQNRGASRQHLDTAKQSAARPSRGHWTGNGVVAIPHAHKALVCLHHGPNTRQLALELERRRTRLIHQFPAPAQIGQHNLTAACGPILDHNSDHRGRLRDHGTVGMRCDTGTRESCVTRYGHARPRLDHGEARFIGVRMVTEIRPTGHR
jgi:hypothetical protein